MGNSVYEPVPCFYTRYYYASDKQVYELVADRSRDDQEFYRRLGEGEARGIDTVSAPSLAPARACTLNLRRPRGRPGCPCHDVQVLHHVRAHSPGAMRILLFVLFIFLFFIEESVDRGSHTASRAFANTYDVYFY